MRLAFQYILWAVGLSLQVLVIRALLRGFYKRFSLLLAYAVTLFLTTVVEVAAYTAQTTGARAMARSWRYYYWVNDAVLQALIYSVVISLIYKAMARADTRAVIRRWLVAGAFVVFVAIFLVHRGPMRDLTAWMTLVSRDLSFAAVILDLLLWSKLIASRKKDHQLLMLSGGLGIQFTGSALGQSIRQLALGAMGRNYAFALAGGVLMVLANFVCLYVWWQTFRRPAEAAAGNKAE